MDTRGRLITTLSRVARQTKPAPDPEARLGAGRHRAGGLAHRAARPGGRVPGQSAREPLPSEEAIAEAAAEAGTAALRSLPKRRREARAPARTRREDAPSASAALARARPRRGTGAHDARPGVRRGSLPGGPGLGRGGRAGARRERLRRGGAPPRPDELRGPAEPAEPSTGERSGPGRRGGRERPERGERRERPARPERAARVERAPGAPRGGPLEVPPELAGDWKGQADFLESRGRTRDAARLHDRHGSFADAARLFEAGGDLRSALRAALAAKDNEAAGRLATQLPPGRPRLCWKKARGGSS
jgi:hypothetical protein